MRRYVRRFSIFLVPLTATAVWAAAAGHAASPGPVRVYASPRCVLYTDLPARQAEEALLRLTAMFEMYRQTLPVVSDVPAERLAVYLYRRFEDYRRAFSAGERLNAGCYDGVALRAALDPETFDPAEVWRVIQHEGWHQYSHRVLPFGGPLPLWLEEGLAEYFAEARWKQGRFQVGCLDYGAYEVEGERIFLRPGRVQRVRMRIRLGQFRPLAELLTLTPEGWKQGTSVLHHDQVWSFTHFLLHADGGARRETLRAYLADCLRQVVTTPAEALPAFLRRWGTDVLELQRQYESWWLDLPVPAGSESSEVPGRRAGPAGGTLPF